MLLKSLQCSYNIYEDGKLNALWTITECNNDYSQCIQFPFNLCRSVILLYGCKKYSALIYEGHLESKERFAIKKYLLIIGKKKNMQVLSHTFTYFFT